VGHDLLGARLLDETGHLTVRVRRDEAVPRGIRRTREQNCRLRAALAVEFGEDSQIGLAQRIPVEREDVLSTPLAANQIAPPVPRGSGSMQ
jgi:hypothetical protein